MTKKILILTFLVSVSILMNFCNGLNVKPDYKKGFVKMFGDANFQTVASQVQITNDGGYVIIGTSGTDQNTEMYIVKTDANGNKMWEKKYGGIGIDSGKAIRQNSDGSFWALGSYYNPTLTASGMYLVKLRADNGDSIKTTIIYNSSLVKRNSFGNDLVVDESSDRICVVGGIKSTSFKNSFSALLDKNGQLVNMAGNPNENSITGYNLIPNSLLKEQNGYVWCGVSGDISGGPGMHILKLNSNLVESGSVDQNTFGANNSLFASQMLIANDGSYILTGSSMNNSISNMYFMNFKFPSTQNNYSLIGGNKTTIGRSIVALSDGSGYVIAGSQANSSSVLSENKDIFLTKVNTKGEVVWEKTFGGTEFDEAMYVKQTSDNGYIVVATLTLSPGTKVMSLIKLDENGDIKN